MARFVECERCGASPDVAELAPDQAVVKCDYCGSSFFVLEEFKEAAQPKTGCSGRSVGSDVEKYVTFVNEASTAAWIFWLDFKGEQVAYRVLGPGNSYRQHTYAGHLWCIRSTEGDPLVFLNATDTDQTIHIKDAFQSYA